MTRDGQFTVQMPDGVAIERLPVGHAAGRWWFNLVLTGVPEPRVLGPRIHLQVLDYIAVERTDGEPLGWASGGSGGDDRAYTFSTSYRDTGEQAVRLTCSYEDRELAREDLDLAW